jgi:TRAP-type C4-dicarboxylate transport system substrate-binding protein
MNDTAHSLFLTSIIVNKNWMSQFDAETQEIMETAAFNAARMERRHSIEDLTRIFAECEAKKVEIVGMNDEEIAKFKSTVEPVYEMYKDYFPAGLVESIQKH